MFDDARRFDDLVATIRTMRVQLDSLQATALHRLATHTHPGGGGGEGGVTDHGALTGLGDDDHTQYLTTDRGDARYYTESEVDTFLAGKQAAGSYASAAHGHAQGDVTGLVAALAGKASASHTHGIADLTATGTRDATTFLRGDGTFAVPPGGGGGGGSVDVTVGGGDPSVRVRDKGANNTASTTHTINMPGGVVAGDRIIVSFSADLATTTASTSSTGYSELIEQAQGTTTNHMAAVYTKVATGSDTLTVTTSASVCSTWVIIVVQNGGTPTAAQANGGSASTATPAASGTLPSGNYLGICTIHTDASSTTSQTASTPSGFSNAQSQNPPTTSSAASFSFERSYTGVTTFTPGTSSLGTSEQWIAFTIAVPGSAGTTEEYDVGTATALGTVDSAYTSGKPKVTFSGAPGKTAAGLDRLSSYTPAASDAVMMAWVDDHYVILGKVV